MPRSIRRSLTPFVTITFLSACCRTPVKVLLLFYRQVTLIAYGLVARADFQPTRGNSKRSTADPLDQ